MTEFDVGLRGLEARTFKRLHQLLGLKLKKNGFFNEASMKKLDSLLLKKNPWKNEYPDAGRWVRTLLLYHAARMRRIATGEEDVKLVEEKGFLSTQQKFKHPKALGLGTTPLDLEYQVSAVIEGLKDRQKPEASAKTKPKKANRKLK